MHRARYRAKESESGVYKRNANVRWKGTQTGVSGTNAWAGQTSYDHELEPVSGSRNSSKAQAPRSSFARLSTFSKTAVTVASKNVSA